jgi:hypothetical protein
MAAAEASGRNEACGKVDGPVISLQAEPAQLYEAFQGRVTIRALIAGRAARVRFVLPEADFSRACEALRDHRLGSGSRLRGRTWRY